jgi:16S rRNA (cytidine1402-2'-O)-methyltransferase
MTRIAPPSGRTTTGPTGPGVLHIVPTPIGNLEDLTLRALRVLREADFIAAEDTRHTRKLLTHHDIHPPLLFSYREQNARTGARKLLSLLQAGRSGALVSDAGMPLVSDPGQDLMAQLLAEGLPVVVLPGPSAFATAVVASGLCADRFTFLGFLPRDTAQRRAELLRVRTRTETLILYEAPHRISELLADAVEVLGDRRAAVARELTKAHEQIVRGTLSDLRIRALTGELRGELAVVIEGNIGSGKDEGVDDMEALVEVAVARVAQGMSVRDAVRETAGEAGVARGRLYRRVLERV